MKVLILAVLPAVALCQLMPGGIIDTTVSADYEPVVFAVKAIKNQIDANGGNGDNVGLLEIVHARTQVVAGQKLYLTLHMTGDYYCDVNVWYRSWLTGDERLIITDGPTCTQHKQVRALGGRAGGISDPKPLPTSGDVVKALEFAACSLNDRINSISAYTKGETTGVMYTQQVTAGMTYRFYNVPMLPTSCRNQGCSSLDLDNCPVNAQAGSKMTCSFTVQFQAWMPTQFTLTDLQC